MKYSYTTAVLKATHQKLECKISKIFLSFLAFQIMVEQRMQFTPEERNFLVLTYAKYKGKANSIKNVLLEFKEKFPNSDKAPHKSTILRMWVKQNKAFTVHNLNSKNSPGESHSGRPRTAITPENIQAVQEMLYKDADKKADDPNVNSCRRNELGLSASSMCRIVKQELKYHCYRLAIF